MSVYQSVYYPSNEIETQPPSYSASLLIEKVLT